MNVWLRYRVILRWNIKYIALNFQFHAISLWIFKNIELNFLQIVLVLYVKMCSWSFFVHICYCSIREICGKEDIDTAYKYFKAFYQSFSSIDRKLKVDAWIKDKPNKVIVNLFKATGKYFPTYVCSNLKVTNLKVRVRACPEKTFEFKGTYVQEYDFPSELGFSFFYFAYPKILTFPKSFNVYFNLFFSKIFVGI